ncbi:MAG: hotdog fold thioesterase [Alphaproteobacteria bacterium]|nr:hotdog fold thioesterase [Alphaproteobacteria bacterium]
MSDRPAGFVETTFSFPILGETGPYFVAIDGGSPIVGLHVRPPHCQARGAAHGGVLATLADVALSYQIHVQLAEGVFVSTTSLTINYVRPARLGAWIEAHCVLDHLGSRNAHAHGRIVCEGETLATMSAAFAIVREKRG